MSNFLGDGPLVSVIISTLNAEKHLDECLNSIFSQRDPSWELIIIDGGSTDQTLEIIRRNEARIAFWMSEGDRGIYDAWNKALPHIRGTWVVFLGADDSWASDDVLACVRPCLEAAGNAQRKIVYGKVAAVNEAGRHIELFGMPWTRLERRFYWEMCIPHQAVFHHFSLFAGGRCFDPQFRYAGDYEFLLRTIFQDEPEFCDMVVARWRNGGVSTRAELSSSVYAEFRLARQLNKLDGTKITGAERWARFKAALSRLVGQRLMNVVVDGFRLLTGRVPRAWS